jgi:hypothetical protein
MDAGLLLRFAHIPSDAGKGYGVFDCINYGTAPQDIGNRINELASQHYGHAGIKWLEYLTQDKDAVMQQAQVLLDSFIEQHSHQEWPSQPSITPFCTCGSCWRTSHTGRHYRMADGVHLRQ